MQAIFGKEILEVDLKKATIVNDIGMEISELKLGHYMIEKSDPIVYEGSTWNIFRKVMVDGASVMQTGILKHEGDIHPYLLGIGTKEDYDRSLEFEEEWDE